VLGDEAQPAASEGPRARAASGPRHAAPRKSLLTKLHVPAGKAVALAAMPTAVLMGMGLTPHLAQADEPKNPAFKPGPCVTQSDTPSPSATGKDAGKDGTKDAKDGKDAGKDAASTAGDAAKGAEKDGKDGAGTAKDTPKPTTSPSAQADGKPAAKDSPSATKAPTQQPTTAAPTPTKSVDPKDPLGLGGLLSGLLGGGKPTATPAPTTTAPKPDPTTTPPAPEPSPTGTHASPSATPKATATHAPVKDAVKGASEAAKKAAKALADPTGSPTASPSATDGSGGTGGSGDPQSYPCPVYDAKALADAQTEPGIPLLPDEPWTLKSSVLTLHGLNYDGIVQVRTAGGSVKDVLKFTATGVDIGDLDQFVVGPGNTHTEVRAAKGSTSTIRNGTVTMYTESLSGNLLGLIPITFTPKAPPPLTLPELFFTDVTVVQAGQFGGDLHVPGMQVLPGQP
jgi:hypothetical protein